MQIAIRHALCKRTRHVIKMNSNVITVVFARIFVAIHVIAPAILPAVTLQWDANSEPSVRGYRVYSGRQSRVYDTVLDVSNRTLIEISATPGTTYFAVTAYDTDNLESDFSEEVSYAAALTNAPTSVPDTYIVTNNLPLTVGAAAGVLANDQDLDGDTLTGVLVTTPSSGVLAFAANGGFTYIPALNFLGTDSFSYRASDGSNSSLIATVTVVVVEEPDPQNCSTCFAALDAILLARANEFPQAVAARVAVSTNETCPQYSVLVFGAVSRSLKDSDDSSVRTALAAAADCLVAQMKGELTTQMAFAAALAHSRWTKAASNQAAAAWRKLDRALAAPKNLYQVPLLNAAANSVQRIDRFMAQGDLAPLLLLNRTFATSIAQQGQSLNLLFQFGAESVVVQDDAGDPLATGQYTYSRTAWNKGTLIISLDNAMFDHPAGVALPLQLKFGRARAKMSSSLLHGYFTLH